VELLERQGLGRRKGHDDPVGPLLSAGESSPMAWSRPATTPR
jgi:hypothetical protein